MTEQTEFRPSLRIPLATGAAGFGVLIGAVVLAGGDFSDPATFFWGALALFSLWLAWRIFDSRIVAGVDGVEVRDLYRTVRWSWDEIERFEVPAKTVAFFNPALRVVKRDGEVFRSSVFQRRGLMERSMANQIAHTVDGLEALRTGRR